MPKRNSMTMDSHGAAAVCEGGAQQLGERRRGVVQNVEELAARMRRGVASWVPSVLGRLDGGPVRKVRMVYDRIIGHFEISWFGWTRSLLACPVLQNVLLACFDDLRSSAEAQSLSRIVGDSGSGCR